jgi:putative ATPase
MGDVPLAARMRPRTFEEYVGQGHLVGEGRALTRVLSGGSLPSIILWGPAGTGKTTLAHLLADAVGAELMQLSAVNSGVADARKIMDGARGGLFRTVLFVDEVHRWSKAQQDVLLPAVEEGTVTLIGATTENPYFSLNTPLLSRCLLLRLEPLDDEAVTTLLRRALDDVDRGLGRAGLTIADDALQHLVSVAGGDARMALTGLEAAADAARAVGATEITRDVAADAVQKKAIVYDRQGDAHYDVVSAFIK